MVIRDVLGAKPKSWINTDRVVSIEPDKGIQGLSFKDVKAWPQVYSAYSPIDWQSNVRILTTAVERIPINPLHLLLTMRGFRLRA